MKSREEILKKYIGLQSTMNWPVRSDHVHTAMSEYAREVAVGFAEWISREGYVQYDDNTRWIAPHNNYTVISTEPLYQLFLQSK
jgi:hypothetical protein